MPKLPIKSPAIVIKETLEREGSQTAGELTEAYRKLVRAENASRPRSRQIRGMTYTSMKTVIYKLVRLGLIRIERGEEMKDARTAIGEENLLIGIRDGEVIIPQRRNVYTITAAGRIEYDKWASLDAHYSDVVAESR